MEGKTRILVVASLVVNLFLAGALIGMLVVGLRMANDRRADDRRGGAGDRPGMWSAFQAIPPERQQVLRRMMREPAVEAAPDLRAARDARRRAAELIGAPAYDAAAVTAALKQARDSDASARAKIDAALASRLAQLSPEERAVFSRVMMRGRGGGDFRRDGRNGREENPQPRRAE